MRIIFDLDGTLLDGDALDGQCYCDAILEVLGVEDISLDWARYGVVTDIGILKGVARLYLGREVSEDERRSFSLVYPRLLAHAVEYDPEAFRRVVPGAPAFLDFARDRFAVGIATGNIRAAAEVKLRAGDLDVSDLPMVTAEDAPTREGLVARCAELLGTKHGRSVSVGDGIWDVQAAGILGVPFVGVAQTDAAAQRLRNAGARTLVSDFLDVDAVWRALETATAPSR